MMVTKTNLSNPPNPTTVTSIAGVCSAPTVPEHNKHEKKIRVTHNTLHGLDIKVFNESTKSKTRMI
jgi:hypothetical protein